MARKASSDAESGRGFNDIIGIVLLGLAVLLLVSLVSYDPRDVSANAQPPNPSAHNWIGPFGAWIAHIWLLCTGLAAFLVPALLLLVGLGFFFEIFSYLRRRWAWTLVLFVCSMGLLEVWSNLFHVLETNLNIIAGGVIGKNLYERVFINFGKPGATIIFLMLYLISLLYLTNFKLGEWVRYLMDRRAARVSGASPAEEALERKKRDLQREAKKLEEQMETSSGLGADLKPVPEPNVVDLSVPQAKPGRQKKTPAPEPPAEPAPAGEVEVIPAREVTAAVSAGLAGVPRVRVWGPADPRRQVAAVSLTVEGWEPVDLAAGRATGPPGPGVPRRSAHRPRATPPPPTRVARPRPRRAGIARTSAASSRGRSAHRDRSGFPFSRRGFHGRRDQPDQAPRFRQRNAHQEHRG